MDSEDFRLSDEDKQNLLEIARSSMENHVLKRPVPEIPTDLLSQALRLQWGAFVSLHKKTRLRGCIGRFQPKIPLYSLIQELAVSASAKDHRFRPVRIDELEDIEIEISVLTPMKKIDDIREIRMGQHGIYIKQDHLSGTFLPQVGGEQDWTREEFLGHCSRDKAGIGWDGWKSAEIYTYEAIIFSEKELF